MINEEYLPSLNEELENFYIFKLKEVLNEDNNSETIKFCLQKLKELENENIDRKIN